MKKLTPYANEADSVGIGDLTIENRTDRVSIYGSIDLTRDREGLQHARDLRDLMDRVIKALEADKNLPDHVPPPEPTEQVDNPFR